MALVHSLCYGRGLSNTGVSLPQARNGCFVARSFVSGRTGPGRQEPVGRPPAPMSPLDPKAPVVTVGFAATNTAEDLLILGRNPCLIV
jgi:hypothetical protein